MTDVRRKRGETFEALLRRFNRRVLLSGKILQARKIRFYASKPTREDQRAKALRGKSIREKYEYLKKIGRLPEEKTKRRS